MKKSQKSCQVKILCKRNRPVGVSTRVKNRYAELAVLVQRVNQTCVV